MDGWRGMLTDGGHNKGRERAEMNERSGKQSPYLHFKTSRRENMQMFFVFKHNIWRDYTRK